MLRKSIDKLFLKIAKVPKELQPSAIAPHVQACFTAERRHHEQIELLNSIESHAAYDLTTG